MKVEVCRIIVLRTLRYPALTTLSTTAGTSSTGGLSHTVAQVGARQSVEFPGVRTRVVHVGAYTWVVQPVLRRDIPNPKSFLGKLSEPR